MRIIFVMMAMLALAACGKSQQQAEQEAFDKYQKMAKERRAKHEAIDREAMEAFDRLQEKRRAEQAGRVERESSTPKK